MLIRCLARVCDPQCDEARRQGQANEAVRFYRNRKGRGPQGTVAMTYCRACWKWLNRDPNWKPYCWARISKAEAVAILTVLAVMEA